MRASDLVSQAMAGLGIPTTRALALVTTGEKVPRDMYYDGRTKACPDPRHVWTFALMRLSLAQEEPGAVVCRVAPSFVRFGSFEAPLMRFECFECFECTVDSNSRRWRPVMTDFLFPRGARHREAAL